MPGKEQAVPERTLEELPGKTVLRAELLRLEDEESLLITFTDGTTMTAGARSGPGLNSEWHTWTEVRINGKTVINR